MKIFTDTFVCGDESQVMSLKAGFKITHIQIICIVYKQLLKVAAQSKHGLTSQRGDNLNMVISGHSYGSDDRSPTPLLFTIFCFWGATNQKKVGIKGGRVLEKEELKPVWVDRLYKKRMQEGEGWKVKPRWELSDRVGFKKRIKVCRLQLSCWVYELSRSFWAEWIKRWGHLVSFSPALESFIQGTCAALQRLTDKSLANERAVSLSVPPLARHIWFQNNKMMMMVKTISRLQKPAGDITVATSIFSSGYVWGGGGTGPRIIRMTLMVSKKWWAVNKSRFPFKSFNLTMRRM